MFEENENDVIQEEITENVDEQTTEELVDGKTEPFEEMTEEVKSEDKTVKTYTEEEFNKRLDELLAKKIARKEDKIRKEYEKKYQPYKEAESVLNAGLGTSNISEATNNLKEYYKSEGVSLPQFVNSYDENDIKVLANADAQTIIDSGLDEVAEEVDRLAEIGIDKMTPREKILFTKLAEYRKVEESKRELSSIGVPTNEVESEKFKKFASQFNSSVPIKSIYELYEKTQNKKQVEQIGSMKAGKPGVKDYYSPEEIERLTDEELDDPKVWEAVRKSMTRT